MHSSLWIYFWISWRHITSSSVAGQICCIDPLESRPLTPNGWKIICLTSSIYHISRNEHAWEMTLLSWPTDASILGNPLSNNNVTPLALNVYVSKRNSLPGQNSEFIMCCSKCMWISWSSFTAVTPAINSILGILMFFRWAERYYWPEGKHNFYLQTLWCIDNYMRHSFFQLRKWSDAIQTPPSKPTRDHKPMKPKPTVLKWWYTPILPATLKTWRVLIIQIWFEASSFRKQYFMWSLASLCLANGENYECFHILSEYLLRTVGNTFILFTTCAKFLSINAISASTIWQSTL